MLHTLIEHHHNGGLLVSMNDEKKTLPRSGFVQQGVLKRKIMNQPFEYKSSPKYIVQRITIGIFVWIAFNFLTGLLTGNKSLDDNYFILTVICIYVAFLSSYKVKFDRGHITTFQFGMVTNNIDLYEASKILKNKKMLTVIYPDNARFSIKYGRLSTANQQSIIDYVKPLKGERPKGNGVINENNKYIQKIIVGAVFSILAIVGLFTSVIYFPSRHGFFYLENDPTLFYLTLTILSITGIVSLIYGITGKLKEQKACKILSVDK
jgi:hypothetical protein